MIRLTCFHLDFDQSNDDDDFYNVSHTVHQTVWLSNISQRLWFGCHEVSLKWCEFARNQVFKRYKYDT